MELVSPYPILEQLLCSRYCTQISQLVCSQTANALIFLDRASTNEKEPPEADRID